ncbi:MAG: PilN domain-containing protein [Thermodesulfobacteriota bacterium]
MSRKYLGIDIKQDSISAVMVAVGLKGLEIESHAVVALADFPEAEDKQVEALKKILTVVDPAGSVCIASLPADRISFRNMRVPFAETRKIKQILPFELEPSLPLSIDDAMTDFHILDLPQPSGQSALLTATVEKSLPSNLRNRLASVGVEVDAITVSGYPAAYCLRRLPDIPEQYLLVDVEPNKAALFAVHGGRICLIRAFGLDASGQRRMEMIDTNIRRTLAAAEEILGVIFSPVEVHVTGSGAASEGFAEELTRLLSIPVKMVNLVRDAGLTVVKPRDDDWRPLLMDNALSLALSKELNVPVFNFGGRRFTAMKQWLAYKKNILQAAFLTGIVLTAAFANLVLDFYAMGKQIDVMDKRIGEMFRAAFPQVTRIVDPVQQMRAEIKTIREASAVSDDKARAVRAIDILNDISKRIPDRIDVDLTQLVIGPDSVQLSGDTASLTMVDDIKNLLENSELFSSATISSANQDRNGNRVAFKLKIQL